MGYPTLPNNRMIVNGVDLSVTYGMIMTDEYVLEPPSPKTYSIDIPGGNGKLDVTEALMGDVAYDNRKNTFKFYVVDVDDFERVKTTVCNFLHGKRFPYVLTMDPEHTYIGRFTVTAYSAKLYMVGLVGVFDVTVDTEPFKYKDDQVYRIDGLGGKFRVFPSGRMMVKPVIETPVEIKMGFNDNMITVPAGTWKLNDIVFHEGDNELYINTLDIKSLTWHDLKETPVTWGEFRNKRLFEWYKTNGEVTVVAKAWKDLLLDTWDTVDDERWMDLWYMHDPSEELKDVYLKYEWGDL